MVSIFVNGTNVAWKLIDSAEFDQNLSALQSTFNLRETVRWRRGLASFLY